MDETEIEIETESTISSPNKRLKTNSPKGKSILQENQSTETESINCCGICLSETITGCSNGISRGFIDSCDHYFCFVCIMEWAKVESKCPLCKRRFSTIRRPRKPPLFDSERVVRVPVRDQVYCNSGNATIGPPNPYSDIKCSICHSIAEENLLLLCDLCDSACHTYCVGLGATVPEGDWFCQDCTLLRLENLESEPKIESCSQVSYPTGRKLSSINETVSVSDIVREPCSGSTRSSRTSRESILAHNIISPGPRRPAIVPAKSSARTLQICHNVHDRIRILRENWDGFQTGKFRFNNNQGANSITPTRLSVSCKNRRNAVSVECSSSRIDSGGADKIRKAWKMFDKAKSDKKVRENSARHPMKKLNDHKESNGMSSKSLCANSLSNKSKSVQNNGYTNPYDCTLKKDYGKQQYVASGKEKYGNPVNKAIRNQSEGSKTSDCTLKKDYGKQQYVASGKEKYGNSVNKAIRNQSEGSKTSDLPMHQDLDLSSSTRASSSYRDSVNAEKLPAERSFHGPCLMGSSAKPLVLIEGQVKDILACKVKTQQKKSCLDKVSDGNKQYNDAKSEIQSLVKLNLKLHMKDEKLEVEAFKEVARLATHSILAACGLEQAKPGYCFSPGFTCLHSRELCQSEKSSLMPNTCTACFCVYVQNIVTASSLQKKPMHEKFA